MFRAQASVAEGRATRLRAAGRTAKAINLLATAGAAKREAREAEEAAAKLREQATSQQHGEGSKTKEAEDARRVAEEQGTAADRLQDVSKVRVQHSAHLGGNIASLTNLYMVQVFISSVQYPFLTHHCSCVCTCMYIRVYPYSSVFIHQFIPVPSCKNNSPLCALHLHHTRHPLCFQHEETDDIFTRRSSTSYAASVGKSLRAGRGRWTSRP